LLACLQLSSAYAQSAIKPVAPKAEKPLELVYQSSFKNYQRYSASPIQSWKQSNDTVKDIGGWRAYAKEITQEQNPKPSNPPTHSLGAHQ
jgi:hypothetical protein